MAPKALNDALRCWTCAQLAVRVVFLGLDVPRADPQGLHRGDLAVLVAVVQETEPGAAEV